MSKSFMYIDNLRTFHNCSVRTGLHAFTAIDTFIFVDVFYPFFIFIDCFYGAGILARHRCIYDGMIRAHFLT